MKDVSYYSWMNEELASLIDTFVKKEKDYLEVAYDVEINELTFSAKLYIYDIIIAKIKGKTLEDVRKKWTDIFLKGITLSVGTLKILYDYEFIYRLDVFFNKRLKTKNKRII